ncbi:MAG TPA: FKBP-type peptidyl-prolyl cis-trans isomerase [Chthoniobacterales bacterium]|jgi:FKBP-type peptidyl-prolyl cis-trans isomerase
MKITPLALVAAFTITSFAHAQDTTLKTDGDKVSYSIGVDIGSTIKRQGIEINPDTLLQGLKDAYTGNKLALTDEQMKSTMETFQKEMMAKISKKREEDAKKNKELGEKFLAENKKKDGVQTTASGLQYKIITEGKGEKPKESDTVVTNYRGTTIDGKEFDSSYKRNEPAEFPLAGVIKGWTEGLQLISVGTKAQFYVPAELAYGDNAPPEIGPGQTLIFDVELLSIKAPEAAPAASESAATPVIEATTPAESKPSDTKSDDKKASDKK